MMILKGTINGPTYPFPGTYVTTVREGDVASPTVIDNSGPVTFIPGIFAKGETNQLTRVKSYNEFESRFGLPYEKRTGKNALAIRRWLNAGGTLLTVNLRDTDATMANLLLSVTTTAKTKTIYVGADGTLYTESPNGVVTKEITLNTYAINLVGQNVAGKNKIAAIDVEAEGMKNVSNPNSALLPIYLYTYKGATKYGNNFTFKVSDAEETQDDVPLYFLEVTNTDTDTTTTFRVTHVTDMYRGTIPLNIADVMKAYYTDLNFKIYDKNFRAFDKLLVVMLNNILTQISTEIDTNSVTELEATRTFLTDYIASVESGNLDRSSLEYMGIFGPSFIPELKVLFDSPTTDSKFTYAMGGGSDGWVGGVEFDWDHTENNGSGISYKPYVEMFKKCFDGSLTPDVFDPAIFNPKFIGDFDYPEDLKQAMLTFQKTRFETPCIYSVPSAITEYAQLVTFNTAWTTLSTGVDWAFLYVGSGDIYNVYESRTTNATVVENMIEELVYICNNRPAPLAGRYLTNYSEGGVYPKLTTAEQLNFCFKNNINYLTYSNKNGYMIDGQAGNLRSVEHPMKELSNCMIAGDIIRDTIESLNGCRHLLKSKALDATNKKVYDEVISAYNNIIDCSFEAYFKDAYDAAVGTVSDKLIIAGEVTTKRNNLVARFVNKN